METVHNEDQALDGRQRAFLKKQASRGMSIWCGYYPSITKHRLPLDALHRSMMILRHNCQAFYSGSVLNPATMLPIVNIGLGQQSTMRFEIHTCKTQHSLLLFAHIDACSPTHPRLRSWRSLFPRHMPRAHLRTNDEVPG